MGFTRDSIRNDNICIIWVDDMIDVFTWRTAFGLNIQTPNIDCLLASGVRFANTYATVPLCAPCRAEVATGLSPYRTGLVDLNRFWRDVLPPERAWAYDLRRAGFYNFTTGKVDSNYKPMPEEYRRVLFHEEPECSDRGRRRNVHQYLGGRGPGIAGVNHPDDDGSQDDYFYDYWVAQNGIDFLKRADPKQRHLMQLGFKHPHMNLDCPDRFYQLYDPAKIRWPDCASPEDFFGPQPGFAVYEAAYIANGNWTPEKAGDEGWRQVVRAYFAACSHVDHEIGRFLDALTQSPLADNTTVIFLSDNGFNLGNHDSFHKMSQWDSAAHVPLGIWSPRMENGTIEPLPVSLHNLAPTIMDLAGLPPRPDWLSGQSLLPLIDDSFGTYDRTKSPVTSVFGTLSVRPSDPDLCHLRYFRYPNGEEHVYDLVQDPGETDNLVTSQPDTTPLEVLRAELVRGALDLGIDLRGAEKPADGVNAMMAVDGSVILAGGMGDNNYWAYGTDIERIREDREGGRDTLWYLGGPDDYVVKMPPHVEELRIATVVARLEGATERTGKAIRVVAHPQSPFRFETSERVAVDVIGSQGDDVMIGPKFGGATFSGGAGNDLLQAMGKRAKELHRFYGGSGDDTLIGGPGNDTLDGGSGNDLIIAGNGNNHIIAGSGNDIIQCGSGKSLIDTGPGYNSITLTEGAQEILVGPGPNRIEAGPGAKTFRLAAGATVVLQGWHEVQVYDLTAWPAPPELIRLAEGGSLLSGPSSGLMIRDCPPDHDPRSQCLSGC
ncbi:MAG: sulfatase-like hydrolase/transferase [Paracoccus sp. (in: a-proteobacteria)]